MDIAAKKFFILGIFIASIFANIVFVSSLQGEVRWVANKAIHEQVSGAPDPALSLSEAAAVMDFSLNNPNPDTNIIESESVNSFEKGLSEYTKRSREVYVAEYGGFSEIGCDNDTECGDGYYCNTSISSPGITGGVVASITGNPITPIPRDYNIPSTNNPPTISGVTNPASLAKNQLGMWVVSASDIDTDVLSYSVSWGDGLTSPAQSWSSFTHKYLASGSYTATFRVADVKGAVTSKDVTVTVAEATNAGTSTTFRIGSRVQVSAEVGDVVTPKKIPGGDTHNSGNDGHDRYEKGTIVDGPIMVGSSPWWYISFDSAGGGGGDGWLQEGRDIKFLSNPTPSAVFVFGNKVETVSTLEVKRYANSDTLGTQEAGQRGTVIGGSISVGDKWWWQVDYDVGVDGWSKEELLKTASAPSIKFVIGNKVKSSSISRNGVQVNPVPGIDSSNSHMGGGTGLIVDGPQYASGLWWWKVDYDTGLDGWSAEYVLQKIEVTKKGVCVPKPLEPECSPTSPCAEGYWCVENVCVEIPDVECTYDDDCDVGYVCSENNTCVVIPEVECIYDDDCSANQRCVANKCVLEVFECLYDSNCSQGYICSENTCVPKPDSVINCTDPDGSSPYVQGNVFGKYANGTNFNFTDYCDDANYIEEYYCSSEGKPIRNGFNCSYLNSPGEDRKCVNGVCVDTVCTPSCTGKVCGDNGCGGVCGTCNSTSTCNSAGQCIKNCVPKTCSQIGKQCGVQDNGCSGTLNCGSCTYGNCINGTCVIEQPGCTSQSNTTTCANAQCDKVNNCGDVVDCPQSCSAGYVCSTSSGMCLRSCVRQCQGKQCGDDTCGGVCGTCQSGYQCNANSQCVVMGGNRDGTEVSIIDATSGTGADFVYTGQQVTYHISGHDTKSEANPWMVFTLDWGDNSPPSAISKNYWVEGGGADLSHKYTSPGTYTVTATAKDSENDFAQRVYSLQVVALPSTYSTSSVDLNFNEGKFDVVYDKSGRNNNARVSPGNLASAWTTGKTGTGLKTSATVPSSASISAGKFEAEIWIKPLVDFNNPSEWAPSGQGSISILDLGSKVQVAMYSYQGVTALNAIYDSANNGELKIDSSEFDWQKNVWYNIKFSYDGAKATITLGGSGSFVKSVDTTKLGDSLTGHGISVGSPTGLVIVDDFKFTSLDGVQINNPPIINKFECPASTLVDTQMSCIIKATDDSTPLSYKVSMGDTPYYSPISQASGVQWEYKYTYTRANNPHRDRQKIISLTVQDSQGASTLAQKTITVLWPPNIPPQFSNFQGPIDMLANESFGTWSIKVVNPEGGEGALGQSVSWVKVDYGDGSPLETPYYKTGDVYSFGMHKYLSAANRTLTFIAQDGNGDTNSTSFNVRVHLSEAFAVGNRVSTKVNAGSFSILGRNPIIKHLAAGTIGTVTAGPLYTYNVQTSDVHYLYATNVWWWMVNFTGANSTKSGWMWEDDLNRLS